MTALLPPNLYLNTSPKCRPYVIILSHTSFTVNLQSIVCLNVKEHLARSSCHIWGLSDSNRIWTHNHLVHRQTIMVSLAKCLSVRLQTKWLRVRTPLVKLQIWCLLWARSTLTFRKNVDSLWNSYTKW